jgi:hypothetical protein
LVQIQLRACQFKKRRKKIKLRKYDENPEIHLNEQGNGRVTLFREGQKLSYTVKDGNTVKDGKIKFDPNMSAGAYGTSDVWPSYIKDGYKYVAELVKQYKAKQIARHG